LILISKNQEHHGKIKLLLRDPDKIVRDAAMKYQTQIKGAD
jgi:hypothetical protein